MKEHRRCECGKLMIKRKESITVDNEQGWYWWCNCGGRITGGTLRGTPELQWYKDEWKRVNNIQEMPASDTVDK